MSEIGSPGIMHDVDLTFEHTPTTPRQSINSLPTSHCQSRDEAFEVLRRDIANPLHGLHVVQVDDEHFFARWRYKFFKAMHDAWYELLDPLWLRNIRSERTYGLVPEREALVLCRYIIHVCLSHKSSVTTLRGVQWLEDIDLIIYIRRDSHSPTVSVRFIAEGIQEEGLQNRAMGFDLVTSGVVRTCKVAQGISWMPITINFVGLLGWRVVIADRHGLQPFTWPSNDDDVEREQLFKSRFGHGAATNSLV